MRLQDAATYFDHTVCADAYTPATTFLGQLDLFDDSKRDGATVLRRVLSTGPAVALPARRAVSVHGDNFIAGVDHKDSAFGVVIRIKYVVEKADGLGVIKTLAQAITATGGTSAYAGKIWIKDLKELDTSSGLFPFYDIFFSTAEVIVPGNIVLLSGRFYFVRSVYVSAAGLLVAESDELPATALSSVAYTDTSGQAYNTTTDTVGSLAPATVAVLWHRFQDSYKYINAGFEKYIPGDIAVNVTAASVPAAGPGDTFTLLSVAYRVISVADDGAGSWILQSRRA